MTYPFAREIKINKVIKDGKEVIEWEEVDMSLHSTGNLGIGTPPTGNEYTFVKMAEPDEWQCYMFGNKPGGAGIVYTPLKGQVPNWFVRWMMKVCLGCTWIRSRK